MYYSPTTYKGMYAFKSAVQVPSCIYFMGYELWFYKTDQWYKRRFKCFQYFILHVYNYYKDGIIRIHT